MKLCYSSWGLPNLPIEAIIKHIAKTGYDAIEIAVLPNWSTELNKLDSGERKHIAKLLRDHHLPLTAVGSYLSMIEPDEEKFAHNLDYVQRAINLAVEWSQNGKPPIVITGFGGRRGELDANRARLVERLQQLGEYAQARGVTIALEAHIDAAVETPDQTVALLQDVNSPAIRANFDISHFNVLGIPIEESVAKMLPWSPHTHVKDERGIHPNYEYLIPGEGEFDYVRYLKAMNEAGYTGAISVEISMMVQRRPNYDPLATVEQSYRLISAAFEKAGVKRGA